MLSELQIRTSIPVSNLDRAQFFYAQKLGLHFVGTGAGGAMFECGGTVFVFLVSESAGKVINSLLTWVTNDIEVEVEEL